jgi:serine phosphatase RsbU (regulator of sigma subunit)/predicted negative regulator of RcsB-dependent stress response
MIRFYFFLFLFFYSTQIVFSQNERSDSLVKSYNKEKNLAEGFSKDTTSLSTLGELMWELRVAGNFKQSLSYGDTATIILNKRIHVTRSKKELDELEIKSVKINAYIALVYRNEGNFPEALKIYYSLLGKCEETKDSVNMVSMYNNIGNVLVAQHNREEAMNAYKNALVIGEKTNNPNLASIYDNIGIMYAEDGKFEDAKKYMLAGLQHNLDIGYKPQIASSYNNLGSLAYAEKDYQKALEYFQLALKMKIESGVKTYLAASYQDIGDVYLQKKDYKNAEKNYNTALSISLETGAREWTERGYKALAEFYQSTGDFKKAFENQALYIAYHDSIQNQENTKKSLKAQVQYEYDKKAAADSVANAQAQKIKDAELTAKNSQLKAEALQRYLLYGGLGLLVIFAVFMFNRVMVTRKQKAIIETQKEVVEEKQKEIVDSINYAKRIQSAILPDPKEIETLFSDAFILFRPKDIVSGDFFWMASTTEYHFIAAADCTGHGVPGGFMSMLGSSLLNEVVIEKKITDPGEILDMLRVKIILALKQKGDSGENKDGMDMVLCRFHRKSNELSFAAANNPLWILRNGKMEEWKADKQPVGIFTGELKMFTQHTMEMQKDDCVYIFTDGFADQFGGPKGKKFKYKQMQEFLLSNSAGVMEEQKNLLDAEFQSWKGNLEQVDDVCVIGIRI